MVSGPVDPTWIEATAREEGFNQVAFERAYRLAHLLGEVSTHPWLSDRLALKGGTAIHFFHTDLARLSVDMDLNYIGSAELEVMQAERSRVVDEITSIVEAHAYTSDPRPESHALWASRFVYENTFDSGDSIKADINFIVRVPLYGVKKRALPSLFGLSESKVPCLSVEEVYGSKLAALATRGAPRDVYDVACFFEEDVPHDPQRLRKAFLFHAYMSDATLQTVDLDRLKALSGKDYRESLYPMLRTQERPGPEELLATVMPALEELLDLTEDEAAFGKRLEKNVYDPALLFGDVQAAAEIEHHPAAEWRRRNPHARLPDG